MNSGIKLWKKAIKIIPGGNSILSKRPERYAPDIWPTYFKKAKGINVWDLDGKKYFLIIFIIVVVLPVPGGPYKIKFGNISFFNI